MQQIKRWTITLFLLLALVGGLGFIKFTQIKAAIAFGESFPEPSETVQAVSVGLSTWQPSLEVVGEVRATRNLTLRNELEGMITQVGFDSGGKVEQGDLLLQQDISTEQAQLEAINAEIQLAELDVKRFKELLDVNAGSREQYDRANAQLAIAKANARALQANIAKKTLTAPFSGTASLHEWEPGTFLAANSLITTLIGETKEVWIDFSLPQRFSQITSGSMVNVQTNEMGSQAFEAKVIAVDQRIDTSSRSMRVRALLNNQEAKLKPGAIAKVQVPIADAITVFKLPNPALKFDSFGSYVFVLDRDNNNDYRASRRAVEFSAREQDWVMVTSGLQAGDLVASVGSSKLTEGMLVYVAEDAQ